MIKLKSMRFATAAVERYKRRETSVEGGHHRDAPSRGVNAPHRGRQQDPVRCWRLRRHGPQPPRQSLQSSRGMEVQDPGLRIPRGHLPEEKLGQLLRERCRHGGNQCERGLIPRGDRVRPRRWRTAICCASIGGASARTMRSSASTGKMRHRTSVVGAFPDDKSALMLMAVRLKRVVDSEWEGHAATWTRRFSRSSHADGWLKVRKTIDGTARHTNRRAK